MSKKILKKKKKSLRPAQIIMQGLLEISNPQKWWFSHFWTPSTAPTKIF